MDTFRNKRKKTKEIYHRINLDNFLSEYKHFQTRCASNERSSNNRANLKLNGIEILVIFAFRLVCRRRDFIASQAGKKSLDFFLRLWEAWSTTRKKSHGSKASTRSSYRLFVSAVVSQCDLPLPRDGLEPSTRMGIEDASYREDLCRFCFHPTWTFAET